MMIVSNPFRFFVDGAVDIDRIRHSLPHDLQVKHAGETVGEINLLDTFESEIRTSGRLLLGTGERVWLIEPAQPAIVQQSCETEWRFVGELPDGEVKKCLQDVSSLRALLPVETRNLKVEQLILLDDEVKTRVRASFYVFELGEQVATVGQTYPITGYDQAHHALVDALEAQSVQSLSVGGDLYSILGVVGRHYHAKPEIPLKTDAPTIETTRQIISTFLRVARDNEPGIKADHDTEFVHDYRVSLRKIRSALSLFKGVYTASDTERLKQTFADIMKTTNRLRDLDVYLLDRTHYFSLLPESLHAGLHSMFAAFEEERQEQLAQVADMLESSAYADTMRELTAYFAAPDALESGPNANELTLPFACRLIWKRYKKVCKIARRITIETPDEDVHTLRIQCKKLRYLLEFFTPLFPRKAIKQLIKALIRLQDNLGRFNDYSVQQQSLQVFLHEYARHHAQSLKLAESIGALVAVLHQLQVAERRQVMENFAGFDSETTRAAFTRLFTQETET
jgi:CHAD domain-containing protein